MLLESDAMTEGRSTIDSRNKSEAQVKGWNRMKCLLGGIVNKDSGDFLDPSLSYHRDSSVRPVLHRKESAAALLGRFRNFAEDHENKSKTSADSPSSSAGVDSHRVENSINMIIKMAAEDRKWSDRIHHLYRAFDRDNDGVLTEDEFIRGWSKHHTGTMTAEELTDLFHMADTDDTGTLDYDEFRTLLMNSTVLSTGNVQCTSEPS